ncbi:MAG: hypothetical protein R2857_13760 [Vampirovibrionales bacterium]
MACAFSGEAVHQYQGHPVPTTAQAIAFDMFFQAAMAHQVSDVHFRIGYPPLVRKNGDLYPTNYPVMDVEAMGRLSVWLNTDANLRLAINRTDLDFSNRLANAGCVSTCHGWGSRPLSFAHQGPYPPARLVGPARQCAVSNHPAGRSGDCGRQDW